MDDNFQIGTDWRWANFYQRSGSFNVGGYLSIARNGGSGYLEVNGGKVNSYNHNIIVGEQGTGYMTMYGGTAYTYQGVTLGLNGGSSGSLSLNGGTLQAGAISKGSGSGYLGLDGGTLQATRDEWNFISGLNSANIGGNGAVIDNDGKSIGINQSLSGSGGLNLYGSGLTTMRQDNTYTGGTTVNGGTLQVAAGYGIKGNLTINAGATVLASDADNTLWRVDATTINSGGALTGAGGNSTHLKSVILNGGTISSSGTVSGSGSDWGTFNFDNGVTTIGSSNTSVISAQNVALTQSGGTIFNVASGANNGIDLLVSGTIGEPSLNAPYTSGLVKQGNGVMVLSGNNSYTKATTISAGTLQVGNGGTSGTLGRGNVANNSSLIFNRSDNYGGNLSNAITGSGSLTVMGGSLNLTASNTYAGLTRVQGGKLSVNGSIAGDLQVDAGATLGGSGTIGGNAVISGTHGPGNSPGLQSFSSDLTYKSTSTALLEFTQNSTAGRGVSFDGINVAGDLSFDPGAGMSLTFNGAGSSVNWNDQFWNNYVKTSDGWLLYSVGGTLSGLNNVTLSGSFLDSNGLTLGSARPDSYFNLYQVGNNVYLNYAVPEPSTYALMGLSALALVVAYRRKRAA